MSTTFKPETPEQALEAVVWAAASETPLEVIGGGSKRGFGRPVQVGNGIDLSGLRGITLYEPEELVLSARAGTPMADIEAALGENRQMLAFEPADLGPLLGGEPGQGTIGGVLACNLAGPRRIKAGAARDHFLGLHAISGRGEAFKSGGRVVKNVTGYDICKLLAGSYGTLAVLSDVTVKVLPAPEKTRTVLLLGLDDAAAVRAMTRAMGSMHEVSAVAHLPAGVARESAVSHVSSAGGAVTAIRVEGPGPSVEYRAKALREDLAAFGESEELHSTNSAAFWREVRDIVPLHAEARAGDAVWRISVPPAAGARVAGTIASKTRARYFFDWSGGLIWLSCPADGVGSDGGAAIVREAVEDVGGHATLVAASRDLRAAVPVFQPQDAAKAALTRRIKDSFDPRRVLNPGRMYAGV